MRYLIILLILGVAVGCNSGCRGIQPGSTLVTMTIANASAYNLNGVEVECSGRYRSAGILIPGSDKTTFDVPWPNSSTMKITFFDRQTLKPYNIEISLVAINERIQSKKCHEVTIRILDYDKAEAVCE